MSAVRYVQLLFANQLGNKIQRKALSGQPGWYFLEIAGDFPLEKKREYAENYDIDFSIHNMVNGHLYHMYLNETQFDYISGEKNINMYSTVKKIKGSKKLAATDQYSVHATKDWNPSYCKPFHEDGYRYIVSNVSESDLENDEKVMSYRPREIPQVANRFASGVLQSGKQGLEIEITQEYGNQLRTPRTLFNKGLTGKGQVVECYDTGIDVNNTYFYDPDNKVTYNSFGNHRKIIRYDTNADDSDHYNGHGTHVAGTIAGKASKTSENLSVVRNFHEHDGIVPEAKIYFVDGAVKDAMAALVNYDELYANMKSVNAGVSANSWGGKAEILGLECPFDERAYFNPEIIMVFAAGNRGKTMTVIPPGSCKNTLTVGNLQSSLGFGVYVGERADWIESPDGTRYPVISWQKYHDYRAGINIINATVKTDLNDDGKGNSVYIYKGDGSDIEKFRKEAFQKNYIGLLYSEGSCNLEFDFPCVKVSADTLSQVEKLPTVSALYNTTRDREIEIYYESSRGPTVIGLTKPEVVAPGQQILSAMGFENHEGETYDLNFKHGTSMATPTIAGIAVIVRQYFEDGYYPSLKPTESDKILKPSSALMKAIIINSAEPKRYDRSYEPDDHYGFGTPILDRALGFVDGIGVTFVDTEIEDGEHAMYKLTTERQQNLTITISYIDSFSKGVNLIYNLDLVVIGPNGEKYSGNHRMNFSSDMSTVNERVHIKDAPAGEYKVHIIALPLKRSHYGDKVVTGIAVMGGFTTKKDALVKSDKPECLTDKCDADGFPECPENKRGNFCQEDIIVPTSNKTKVQLRPKYTKWLHIKPGKRTDLIFTATKGQNYIFDVSTSKPRGQWLYSDFTMLIEMEYSTYVNLSFEEYQNYVDENGEVYIGLTTIGGSTKDLTMELSYNPEPEKPKPPVNPPVDTPVEPEIPPVIPPVETKDEEKSQPIEEDKSVAETISEGNPDQGENNQGGADGGKDPNATTGIIIGSVVAAIVVIAGVAVAIFFVKKSKKVSDTIDVDV